jgi:glycosyltransferase involved in cell wall biosynthesis
VPTGDVEGFAARIAALLRADAVAERMASAALGWSQRFDWNLAADDLALAIEAAQVGS